MSTVNDIRTIAKTTLLEEKIAKALAQSNDANSTTNPGYASERGITTQNDVTTQTFGAANGPPPDGDVLQVPASSGNSSPNLPNSGGLNSYIASINPSNTTNSDILSTSQVRAAVANTNGNQLSTDMSASAIGSNQLGGSNIAAFATQGSGDTTLSQLNSQVTAMGFSADAKQNLNTSYNNQKHGEPGAVTAKSIGDSYLTSPSVSLTNGQTAFADTSLFTDEQVRSVSGFDPNGQISPITGKPLAVKVNLVNQPYPTPQAIDSTSIGKTPWTDGETPPLQTSYTAGSVWAVGGSSRIVLGNTFDAMMVDWDSDFFATHGLHYYSYGTINIAGTHTIVNIPANINSVEVFMSTRSDGIIGHSANLLGGTIYGFNPSPGSGYNGAQIGHYLCSTAGLVAVDGAVCAMSQPYEINWPKTGSYVINATNVLATSLFDSEAPLSVTSVTSSVVRLAMGNGIDIIDSRFLQIAPAVGGGKLFSVIAADGATVLFANYYDASMALKAPGLSSAQAVFYQPR